MTLQPRLLRIVPCFVLVDGHHAPFPISAVNGFNGPRLVPIRRPDVRGFLSVAQRAKKIEILSHASVNGCYRLIEGIHGVTERIHDSASLVDGSDILAPMGALTLLGPRRRHAAGAEGSKCRAKNST
jgi:hypothetical protein